MKKLRFRALCKLHSPQLISREAWVGTQAYRVRFLSSSQHNHPHPPGARLLRLLSDLSAMGLHGGCLSVASRSAKPLVTMATVASHRESLVTSLPSPYSVVLPLIEQRGFSRAPPIRLLMGLLI